MELVNRDAGFQNYQNFSDVIAEERSQQVKIGGAGQNSRF